MDSEGSSNSSKRRRRGRPADRLALEKHNHVVESGEEDDEDSCSPPRPSPNPKQGKKVRRRRKSSSSSDSMEEDIIDGFSIRGFRTLEDLENLVKSQQKKLPPENPPNNNSPSGHPNPTATIVKPPLSPSDGGAVGGGKADAAPEAGPVTPLVVAASAGLNAMTNATTPTMPTTAVTAIAMETATTPTPNPSRPSSPASLPALPTSTPTAGDKSQSQNHKKDTKKGKRLLDGGKIQIQNQIHPQKLDLREEKLEQRLNKVVLDNQLECLKGVVEAHSKADLAPLLDAKVQHKVEHIVGRVVNAGGPQLPLPHHALPLPLPSTILPPTMQQNQQQQSVTPTSRPENCGRAMSRVVVLVGGENNRMAPQTPPLSLGVTSLTSTTTTTPPPMTLGGKAHPDQKVVRLDRADRTDTKQENRTLDHRIEHRTENPKEQLPQQQQPQLLLHHQLQQQQQSKPHQSPQQQSQPQQQPQQHPLEHHHHRSESQLETTHLNRHLENNKLPDHKSIIKIQPGPVRPQPQQHLLQHQTHHHHQHHHSQQPQPQHQSSEEVVDKKPSLSQLQQNGPSHQDRPFYHDRVTEGSTHPGSGPGYNCNNDCGEPVKVTSVLTYWNTRDGGTSRQGAHVLTMWQEFLLTMVWLRHGLQVQMLGTLFGVSNATVTRIYITWLNFLYQVLKHALVWPSQDLIRINTPPCFKKYPKTRCIIDCTEIFIARPRNPTAAAQTYSHYKSHNTFKVLVGISPAGAFTFISKAYSGSISDRSITKQSGFIDLVEAGDHIMADRGFLIRDLLLEKGAKLNIPPFTRAAIGGKGRRLTAAGRKATKYIARVRIHVERAIRRMKVFKVLSGDLHTSRKDLIDQILVVVAVLCNMQRPLF